MLCTGRAASRQFVHTLMRTRIKIVGMKSEREKQARNPKKKHFCSLAPFGFRFSFRFAFVSHSTMMNNNNNSFQFGDRGVAYSRTRSFCTLLSQIPWNPFTWDFHFLFWIPTDADSLFLFACRRSIKWIFVMDKWYVYDPSGASFRRRKSIYCFPLLHIHTIFCV